MTELPMPPAPRLGWKAALGLLAALLAVGSLHLLHPDARMHRYSVKLCGPVRYYYNVDSAAFARLVIKFPEGFSDCEQGRIRQMRPLYPALGRAVYALTRPLAELAPAGLAARAESAAAGANHPEIWRGIGGRQLIAAWAALLIVSVLCNWLALALVADALRAVFAPRLAWLLALVPALHFNAVGFLLVPSSECFNLLASAVLVWCAARVWSANRPGALPALGLGILMLGKALAYPFPNWLYEHLWLRPWRENWRKALLAAALFAAPVGLYLLALALGGVRPRNCDTEAYREVVWMLDYLRAGRPFDIVLRWGMGLGLHLWYVAIGFGPPLLVALFLLLRRDRAEFRLPGNFRRHVVLGTAACAGFWMLVGLYDPRLALTQYPAVVVLLGVAAARKSERPELWVAAALALAACAWWVRHYHCW